MGRFSNAERLFIQAAEKLVKAKLSTDELILRHATVLNNLATLYKDISRFIEAEYLYLLVKEIREEKLGTSAAQQNPLARSGLAFAGANTVLDGGNLPPEAEDGLLTAQGASGINLAATALVVASACQTALGDVLVGEGILGLRRAFVLAGAQTLVMSLWSVPDVSTAILMEQFYHNLLTEKMGRAKALEQAQFYVRDLTIAGMRPQWLTPEAITRIIERSPAIGDHLRQLSQKPGNYRPYAHPRYWGAFICQGDAAPL